MNMTIFVGVDCSEQHLTLGFVGSQGILRALSRTTSPPPGRWDVLGQRLEGMIRGLRGEVNLRMKNLRGIGIGLPGGQVDSIRRDILAQPGQKLGIAVHVEDRDILAERGRAWLAEVADMLRPQEHPDSWDLSVVYGAAKLARDFALRT